MLAPFFNSSLVEAGCDEAGRGCLAGPVYAAAVILPKDFNDKSLNDSKQISIAKRNKLRERIENEALSWAVASVDHEEIDKINILNASFLAMHRALDQLNVRPESLLIDGNRFKPAYQDIPHHCMIKGDARFQSIAAASILAKTYRDEYMEKLAEQFPEYQWHSNKGYPTKAHRAAIQSYGITPHHRKSFRLLPDPALF